jgi:hypothetical protein
LLAVLKAKDEWKFTITVHGEQFVMMFGTSEMLVLSADSLVFQMLRLLTGVLILVKGLDRFGLTMLVVQVMSHRYFHAAIVEWEVTTVVTVKTRAYVVMTKVRVSHDKILNVFKAFVKLLQATKLYLLLLLLLSLY